MTGTIIGNYRIAEKLGEGGMGAVYRAVDLMLEREVAIKVLRPDLARDAEFTERFRSEAVLLGKLASPGIATVYGLFREAQQLYMVMEYVRGETLDRLLARDGRLDWVRAFGLAVEILEALGPAHQAGIVHRDIKPSNLMRTPAGDIKILDFGIARMRGTVRCTRAGGALGTLAYMAPEQLAGTDVDQRADLYAVGVVLYELVTGRLPYDSADELTLMRERTTRPPAPPATFVAGLPEAVAACIMKALAADAADRFGTAKAFAGALSDLLRACDDDAIVRPTRLGTDAVTPATRLASGLSLPGAQTAAAGPWSFLKPRRSARAAGIAAALVTALIGIASWGGRARTPAPTFQPPVADAAAPVVTGIGPASSPLPPAGLVPDLPVYRIPEKLPVSSGRSPSTIASPPSAGDAPPAADEPAPPAEPAPRAEPKARPAKERPAKRPAGESAPEAVDTARRGAPKDAPATPAVVEVEVPPGPSDAPPTPAAGEAAGSARSEGDTAPGRPAEPELRFERVKLVTPDGDRLRERDAVLMFRASSFVVVDEDTGTELKEIVYASITGATYSRSKHPRWKEGAAVAVAAGVFAAPVFFMKGTKHWLTVQTADDYLLMRLDKNNYRSILPAFETRAQRPVDREAEEG